MSDPKFLWPAIGLMVGVVGVTVGALEALIAFLFTGAGWLIGKYMAGEIRLIDLLLERFFSDRLRGPRA